MIQIAHILRKYNPNEWGGTETALRNLLEGMSDDNVSSTVFCPKIKGYHSKTDDPIRNLGCKIERFDAFLPVWNISWEKKERLISLGGNLLSFKLPFQLWNEKISLIHSHTGNRLGTIGLRVAHLKKIPFVITLHGGFLDLSQQSKEMLTSPLKGSIEWGKVFSWILGTRSLLKNADAILTCNKKEALLLKEKYPLQKIIVQPHGVSTALYQEDCRLKAIEFFPSVVNRKVLLIVARIDSIKNQSWVIEQLPSIIKEHPDILLVLAGACTDEKYGEHINRKIVELGLQNYVLLTGGIPANDPRLIGLYQIAKAVILPSIIEPFGLTILEAWAAGTPILASRTTGALELINDYTNGILFDLSNPQEFQKSLKVVLTGSNLSLSMVNTGQKHVEEHFSINVISQQVLNLYRELIEEKNKSR